MISWKNVLHKYLSAAMACSAVGAYAATPDPMADSQKQKANVSAQKGPTNTAPSAVAVTATTSAIASERSHLLCTFRISKSGAATLVRAAEVKGEPILPEVSAGPLLYEVNNGAALVSTEGLPDPFEMRSTPGPVGSGIKGHHIQSTQEAEVVVKIPGSKLSDLNLGQLSVTFYQNESGEQTEKLDAAQLHKWKASWKLRRLSEVPAQVLGSQIKLKAVAPNP